MAGRPVACDGDHIGERTRRVGRGTARLNPDAHAMKKLLIATALILASASAEAKTYTSGNNRVVVPKGCSSWSCISVSVPGHYSHNVKPVKRARAR
jgi:hypothetical protein